jgi:hypothetical protein
MVLQLPSANRIWLQLQGNHADDDLAASFRRRPAIVPGNDGGRLLVFVEIIGVFLD